MGVPSNVMRGRANKMSESRIKELQAEKVRLSNLDADNMLDKKKYKERMLKIDMMIKKN